MLDPKYQPVRNIDRYVTAYLRSLPDLTGKVVVDIPCGDGRASDELHKKGASVRAFDLYPEFNKADGVEAEYADLNDGIPMDDASADMLICQEGIEHMPDKIALLSEFNRVLKPGGTLIVSTPSISYARARLSMLIIETDFWRRMPPTEIDSLWFTEKETDRLYFGHLFLVGAQHLQTVVTMTGFAVTDRRKTAPSGSSYFWGSLMYPFIALMSVRTYYKYLKKVPHVEPERLREILWDRVKLNLEPNTMFRKHLFWIMRKEATVKERTAELKELTRYKNPELSG